MTLAGAEVLCPVLLRLSKAALVLALACSIGLHWAFLQSVAWVGMVVSYSEQGTFTEALSKTFDGRHPCPLCKEIAKSRKAEKKSAIPAPLKKFEGLATAGRFVFSAPRHFWLLMAKSDPLRSIPIPPPTPPPRGFFI